MNSLGEQRLGRLLPRLVALLGLLGMLPGLAPALAGTPERLLLLVNIAGQPAVRSWCEGGADDTSGPLCVQLGRALQDAGVQLAIPAEDRRTYIPGGVPLTEQQIAALAGSVGARRVLTGELVFDSSDALPELGLQQAQVSLRGRLIDLERARSEPFSVRGEGFEPGSEDASRQAFRKAVRSLGLRLKKFFQPAPQEPPPGPVELQLRVRGLRKLSELRQLVQRIQERQAGVVWIDGATPGEARLVGQLGEGGMARVITALVGEDFPDFVARVHSEQGRLVIEVEPRMATPSLPLVPAP